MVNGKETFGIDPAWGHPERTLAFGYAPRDRAAGLAALFALDATLGGFVARARDPLLAQMRLTWWHDALTKLDAAPPPPQPVLAALHREILPRGVSGAELARLIEGWEALLAAPPDIAGYAETRGAWLFALAGRVLGADDPQAAAAGRGWALGDPLIDLPVTARAEADALLASSGRRWSRAGRALGALALIARATVPGAVARGVRRESRDWCGCACWGFDARVRAGIASRGWGALRCGAI